MTIAPRMWHGRTLLSLDYRHVVQFASWLVVVNVTSEESSETQAIDDGVVKSTVANIPNGSMRLVATALAAYVFFGYAKY